MKASIIIPNFNGEKLLAQNLPFLLKAMENGENKIAEIIVVDDGSWDGSVKLIKTKFPQIKLIKHTKNRGFSASVNTGARAAKEKLIVLLNSDVVPSEDFLSRTLNLFEDKNLFAVSMHEQGYGWAKGTFSDGFVGLAMGEEGNSVLPSFYVSGGSGVFKREIWMELGGMDEKLLSPFYWEDIDICYRALKRGYLVVWNPEAKAVHNHESTIGKLPKKLVARIRERNQLIFIWKNITSKNLTRKHFAGLAKRFIKHPGYLRIIFMALAKLGLIIKARKKEAKESKVSDEAIFSRFN